MSCERQSNCGHGHEHGCSRQEYNCRDDRKVIKHHHIVKHKHDIINEYDVIHRHDHHYYDVVKVREEHKHHDHRNHKPDYCPEGSECSISTVGDNTYCESGCEE
ncbi:MAG: hypothetical protein LBC86_05810 [Oscillospiraceae bacterium]|nr:hypothetical protein [Oscillospiraceae bacterium]